MSKFRAAAMLCMPLFLCPQALAGGQNTPGYSASDVDKYFSYQVTHELKGQGGNCDPRAVVKGPDGKFAHPNCADKLGASVPYVGDIAAVAVAPAVISHYRYHGDLNLTFETGSAVLTSQDQVKLREFSKALNMPRWASHRVAVSGYSDGQPFPQACGQDEQCTNARNLELSRERAEAAKEFLIKTGVEPDRLEANGYGTKLLHALRDDRASRRVFGRLLN
jgi:hypothetical protein